jgi:hypothetical protein
MRLFQGKAHASPALFHRNRRGGGIWAISGKGGGRDLRRNTAHSVGAPVWHPGHHGAEG